MAMFAEAAQLLQPPLLSPLNQMQLLVWERQTPCLDHHHSLVGCKKADLHTQNKNKKHGTA